jgi:hypothetical protein
MENVPLFIIKDQEVYSSISEKDMSKRVLDIIEKKFASSICINDKNLDKATKKHVNYIIANNTISSIQKKEDKKFYAKTPKKRYNKASGKFNWFARVYDKSIILKYPVKDFINPEQVFDDIDMQMEEFIPNIFNLSLRAFFKAWQSACF